MIDATLAQDAYALAVKARLCALQHDAAEEGRPLPTAYLITVFLRLLRSRVYDVGLTICATPDNTIICRWFDANGKQVLVREYEREEGAPCP